ncbi:MAG: DUF3781 domain-containing protein [Cocleimonas sp.]
MNEPLKRSISESFRNTPMGFLRIKRNLGVIQFSDAETEAYLRGIILSTPLEDIEVKGKNYYFNCYKSNAILTINSSTLTVITAKKINKS